jgi:hypothetical protein
MDDELLAGAASLVGVVLAGVHEGLRDTVPVDDRRGVAGVLLDDGKQVGEQPALELVELVDEVALGLVQRRGCNGTVVVVLAAADAFARAMDTAAARGAGTLPVLPRAGGRDRTILQRRRLGAVQAAAVLCALLRNRRPSSYL